MGTISATTFRRLYLLYLLAQFRQGSFGAKRLQKVTYIAERESKIRPFEYRRNLFGQYSEALEDVKEQLMSMDYVDAVPLDTARIVTLTLADESFELVEGGNRIYVTDKGNIAAYGRALQAVDRDIPPRIRAAVGDYGYRSEAELIEICYSFAEFQGKPMGALILGATLPDEMQVDLPDEECDDLELSMNPQFVVAMSRLSAALQETSIDWEKVKQVERRSVPGT